MGKSVIFTQLTGRYAEVSNFPGTTVEISRGRWQGNEVSDSPGIYGLTAANPEEKLTEKIVARADIIVNVVDATNLRRDLFLTLQLRQYGPLLVVVNMMDEAHKQGLQLDLAALATQLGAPVVPAAAIYGKGKEALDTALNCCLHQLSAARQGIDPSVDLRSQANEIYQLVAGQREIALELSPLDRWLTRPVTGLLTGGVILAVIWWVIGSLVADKAVNLTEGIVMNKWLLPPLVGLMQNILPSGGMLEQVVLGDFGIVTMVLGYGIGLLLPLVLGFYILLAVLEDSGYMPRLAVLLDNIFRPLGLNGKAVIPLILGFGCVTMAVISTRVLANPRERVVLTFLLCLAVPCSAQMGIIAMMLVPMGLKWLALYIAVLSVVFIIAGSILNRFLPGQSSGLFLELPRIRWPRWGNIWRKSTAKSWAFLKDAIPLFALGSVLVTLLDYWGVLRALEGWLAPVTAGWLNLPPQVLGAFIMGMIRRDFGAAGLHTFALPPAQRFVALMTLTLFVPCIAAVLMVIKEQGWRIGVVIWTTALAAALLVGRLLTIILM